MNKTVRVLLFGLLLTVGTCALPQAPAPQDSGYDAGYVPGTFSDMTIPLGGSTIDIQLFEAARNATPNVPKLYAYTPYFLFVKFDTDGKKYQILDGSNGTKIVKMRLALFDDSLKTAAASWISSQSDFSVAIGSVQLLPIWSLVIKENNSGLSASLPGPDATPTTRMVLSPVTDVYFRNVPESTANSLKKAIEDGYADFSFTYSYKKSANLLGAYTVTYKDVQNSSVFQNLTGGGGIGFVTRDGAARIASMIVGSLDVISYTEDPSAPATLTQDVINLFTDKMQFSKEISFATSEDLKKLNQLTLDPKGADFEADQLRKTHDVIASSHDFNELNKNLQSGGGGGGFGGFNANANFSSNSEVNKAIKDTFDRDWTGDDWSKVPKTLNVYQISGSDFSGSTTVRLVNVKPTFSMQSFEVKPVQVYLTFDDLAAALKTYSLDRFVLVPIGSVLAFAGPIDDSHRLPSNFRVCDGTAMKKADFNALWEAIGKKWGDGSQQRGILVTGFDFNLPDMRGYFLRGVDDGAHRDPDTDRIVGSSQPADMESHSHGLDVYLTKYSVTPPGRMPEGGLRKGDPGADYGMGRDTLTTNSYPTGSDKGKETRPSNVAVYWIIRVR